MSSSEKTVQDLLREITEGYEEVNEPVTYTSRGFLKKCNRLFLLDSRLITNILVNVIKTSEQNTKNIGHLTVYTGFSETSFASFVVDVINSSLIWTVVSTEKQEYNLDQYLSHYLSPESRSVKQVES